MSERSLVVHQQSLTDIETAMGAATEAITTQLTELMERVNALTPGWEATSDSHLAHEDYQRSLLDGVKALTEALDGVRKAVATYREDAREIEVENVAIVG